MSETPSPEPAAEADWWDDPSLPWRHKPTRADIVCLGWMTVMTVYSVVVSVARPTLLALGPHILASLGSWSGMVLIGARASVGDPWWPLVLFLGTLGLVKFDWVFWWAGRLWGRSLIDTWSGRSERARKINAWAERFARKYETLALVVSLIPFVPGHGVVAAVLGEAGISLRKLLTVSILTSAVVNAGLLAVGYWIGEPAVAVMDAYGRYLLWLSLALLVVVVISAVRQQRARKTAE